jgi:hypothetical protein
MATKSTDAERRGAPNEAKNLVAESWLEYVQERRRHIARELKRLELEDQNLRYQIDNPEPPKHA